MGLVMNPSLAHSFSADRVGSGLGAGLAGAGAGAVGVGAGSATINGRGVSTLMGAAGVGRRARVALADFVVLSLAAASGALAWSSGAAAGVAVAVAGLSLGLAGSEAALTGSALGADATGGAPSAVGAWDSAAFGVAGVLTSGAAMTAGGLVEARQLQVAPIRINTPTADSSSQLVDGWCPG